MSVIQASSAGVRDMADGSLRITLEFDPRYAKEAYALFGARGTACAVAALTKEASTEAARKEVQEPKEKPGELCIMACNFCKDPVFQEWICADDEKDARAAILECCGVTSRRFLDTDQEARRIFIAQVRNPFMAHKEAMNRPRTVVIGG